MITSQGRYEPSPAGRVHWWPIKSVTARTTEAVKQGECVLSLDLGNVELLIYDQDAASLEVLGHALIRLAEEQRRETAKRDLEPLQEK